MTRVALAPIKDSQLNSAPNTPLRKQPKVSASSTPVVKPVVKPSSLFRTSPRKSPTKLSVFRSPHSQRVDKAAGQLRRQLQMAVSRVKASAPPSASSTPAPLTRPSSAPTVSTLAALARASPTRRHSRPKVSLTSIARRRLRIYRVKKTSSFYQSSSSPSRLPLTGAKVSLPRIACHDMDHQRFILPYAAAAASAAGAQPLPSINIILKTPIRNAQGRAPAPGASMARSRSASSGASAVAPRDASSSSAASTEDTTIDDDDTTIANVTATGDDSAVKRAERRRPVLTSSPLQNPLGTPSSFSVAKSLLQLAGNM
ncbi:hypothetical protein DIURU_001764 [Diutina rugosa]|uniref:Uncharacterized protein n=1 Tax=Diutina rugosa TaxID=5481 RepID=A0A642USS3_DIURU|nr:uncharacterized protein DIURU_001764 [Diutina rugosa]KAA8904928.1 hypothetical protein DIURU_001764 [Diutina rugosa]